MTMILRFASGAYVSLIAAPIVALGKNFSTTRLSRSIQRLTKCIGETGDVGRRTGLYFTVLATGAIAGPPISGAINVATGGYTVVGIYAGKLKLLCL